ncbi:MAG: DUF1573 domain-containing protein [Bacteroides sp.]|nr:DUF1573 domain-containing protein [Bacteroides sp.]
MKNRKVLIYVISIYLFLFIASCKKNEQLANAKRIVAEWVGKEIQFPSDVSTTYWGRDTIYTIKDTPFKILIYTDSVGCTSCKLQLYKWMAYMQEASELMADKVSFHFYFHPKDESELNFQLKRDNFRKMVFMDREGKLDKLNKLPKEMNYQCFLLNEENKVLLIGNPVINPQIWDLYKRTITKEETGEPMPSQLTTLEAENTEIELENLKINQLSIATFILHNTGDIPLVISDISASCGCTVPEWDKRPINPGAKTEIKIRITPDTSGYFNKTIIVYCNSKEGSKKLILKGLTQG